MCPLLSTKHRATCNKQHVSTSEDAPTAKKIYLEYRNKKGPDKNSTPTTTQ